MNGYALRLEIKTWRWADVPFYIRAGSRVKGSVEVYEPGNWWPASAAAVVTAEHGWYDLTPEASALC